MKAGALALALGLVCAHHAGAAPKSFQARCEAAIDPASPSLSARQNGYSIDNTLSFRRLTQMKGAAAGSFVLGLTRSEARISIGFKGPILGDGASGYECVAPRIAVDLSYLPIVIHVGREFVPGSCAYEQILAHEMRHLKAYFDHLAKVDMLARAALEKRFGFQAQYAPAGRARDLLAQEIDGIWLPYLKAEMAKVEQTQASIDSPQEYARLSKLCKGEVQFLIRAVQPVR
jgi:hypothetical protein